MPFTPARDGEYDVSRKDSSVPHPHANLEECLRQISRGDERAFTLLYEATVPRVFGLVRRVLVDPSQAEEVSQEVYLELWQTAARFQQDRGSAVSWIFTVAHRRAVDRVRASQASRDRDLRIGTRDIDIDYDSVIEDAEIRLEGRRVEQALGDLSDKQRQAIVLAYFAGLSQAEIAVRLAVPLGTVKTRIRDGLLRLRAVLADSPIEPVTEDDAIPPYSANFAPHSSPI